MYVLKYPEKGRFLPEGIVIEWMKNEGDSVKQGDLLMKIETEGQWLELESASEGTVLKTIVGVGCFIRAGDPLAVIGNQNEDVSQVLAAFEETKTHPAEQRPEVQPQPKAQPDVATQPKPTDKQEKKFMTPQSAAGNPENVIPILMPQAGQSMEEGTILSWKIKEGDTIDIGQVIMEIETDKATMEVEAVDGGRVSRIVAAEGDIVEVKKPVAYIADNDADVVALLGGSETTAAPAPTQQAPAPPQPSVSVPEGAVIPILMPQAGQSMEEGTILSWKVNEGDRIEVGQVIMEIETDKATMEVEAVDAGRIAKIVAAEGDIIEVKKPVAYLAEEGVDIDAYLGATATSVQENSKPSTPTPAQPEAAKRAPAPRSEATVSETGRVKASPAARKAAQQRGIDLASIGAGSGPGGRILSTDVEGAKGVATKVQVRTLSKMRKAIARNLSYSKQTIPHFYAKKTIDAGPLFSTYRKTKEQFKCSVNDFVTRACARAIREYPAFRSQFQDNEVTENPAVNIGIAVGTDEGLTVPVVVNADQLNLEQLAAQTRKVVESARNGKLEGIGQGIFTITNLGMFGLEEFSAIINPPESAILAVGAIQEGVLVENGQMRPTRLMTMTLSVDHRVIDGVLAAQFLNTLQELLENPEQLVS